MNDKKLYDLVIIGTGAAGYTASIYASRYKLSNIIIGEMMGGQTAEAIGFSSNFGDQHQYTVKISLSHAGHEDAVGAGFNWQW